MSDILLVGVNSRYSHTSLALRYLRANLEELRDKSQIVEFTINENEDSIVENILLKNPKIVGIGVYIWNALQVKKIVDILKAVTPDIKIVLGGPEVSHLPLRVDFSSADFIIQGEGEVSFYHLCKSLLSGKEVSQRVLRAIMPDTKKIKLPYDEYTSHDIQHRLIYVEASRGCPFECEFCLSAIDERVRYFDVDEVLSEFTKLWDKGVRNFKFIDRTFNLNIAYANKIMDFFLSKDEPYSLHFEVVPDNFPTRLKEKIKLFPPHSLQLEIGIQSLNGEILANINRKMDIQKAKENIAFLENETNAHLHVDLIIGLPGESIESFADNLNRLKEITNSEIQLGVLKKLSGTTISRWDKKFGMIYSSTPPYEILQNDFISYLELQKLKRFARFWDLVYNSGNFHKTKDFIWQNSTVYDGFYHFSEWIYNQTQSTWQISLMRLSELIFRYLTEVKGFDKTMIADSILDDIIKVEGRKVPGFLREYATHVPNLKNLYLDKARKRQVLRNN